MLLEPTDDIVRYYCYMEIHDIPYIWNAYNTHRSELDGGEAEEALATELLLHNPRKFHLMTKGITLKASKVLFDNRPSRRNIELVLDDGVGDGIYCGGALLDAIFQHRNEDMCQRAIYVEVELLTGVSAESMEEFEHQRSL